MTNNSNRRKPTARELVAAKQVQGPGRRRLGAATARRRRPQTTAVAVPDNRPYRARYLDEVAPSGIAGRLIKFDKSGKFVTSDDGSEIDEGAEFTALCDQTVVGWQRFNGPGEPPDKVMGLLYDGFVMPPRESPRRHRPERSGRRVSPASHKTRGNTLSCSSCRTRRRLSCSPSPPAQRPGDVPSALC